MEPSFCDSCKWCYRRRFTLDGIIEWFCTWRKHHRKTTNYDDMKYGRIVRVERIKNCKHYEKSKVIK